MICSNAVNMPSCVPSWGVDHVQRLQKVVKRVVAHLADLQLTALLNIGVGIVGGGE